MSLRERAEIECAIHSLRRLYASGDYPGPGDTCIETTLHYLAFRGWDTSPDVRQMYRQRVRGQTLFGTLRIDAMRSVGDALGLTRRTDPIDVRLGDILLLGDSGTLLGVSIDGPREVLAVMKGKLTEITWPRILAAWDSAPPAAPAARKAVQARRPNPRAAAPALESVSQGESGNAPQEDGTSQADQCAVPACAGRGQLRTGHSGTADSNILTTDIA